MNEGIIMTKKMKLDFQTINSIASGVSYLSENGRYIQFHRFNMQEEKYYEGSDYKRHYATSGVKLVFQTNSTNMKLSVYAEAATPVSSFSHDIFVNGKMIGHMKNFSDSDLPIEFDSERLLPVKEFSLGCFEEEYSLGTGVKEVCIVFPWTVNSMLEGLWLDEGASVRPVRREGTIVSYGDSITYGSFALYPSNRYMSKLAERLSLDEICKAVGGEVFCPGLISCAESSKPDYVVVAYGTNDFYTDIDALQARIKQFFEEVVKKYKDSIIIAISPIWRTECEKVQGIKELKKIETCIKETTELYGNIKFISGYDLVPHDIQLFADASLHPNDEGFQYYVKNLCEKLK